VWLWFAEGLGINFLTAVCRLRWGLEGWRHTTDNQYRIPFLLFLASLFPPSQHRTVVVWREGSHLPVYWPARVDIIVNVPTRPVALMHAQKVNIISVASNSFILYFIECLPT